VTIFEAALTIEGIQSKYAAISQQLRGKNKLGQAEE